MGGGRELGQLSDLANTQVYFEDLMMEIEIVRAGSGQESVVGNLLQLYAYDFSEFYRLELGADGRFVYKDLPLYFRESNRHAFLVRKDGTLAGLILVQRGSQISDAEDVWDMTEFFVVRGCRRHGVGTEMAHRVWRQFPGKWEVRVMEANRLARHFWERAIALYVGREIAPATVEKDGIGWRVFSFESQDVGEELPRGIRENTGK